MRPRSRFLLPVAVALVLMPAALGARAADDAAAPAANEPPPSHEAVLAAQKAKMDELSKNNAEAAKLPAMAEALYKGVSPDEAKRLVLYRNGFGMVRAVSVVKDQIGKTVEKCGEANPAMKSDMDKHFAAWQDTVMPAMTEQQKHMDKAMNKDNFTNPDQVRAFFDQLDKMAAASAEQQERNAGRITTPSACGALIKSMDDNKDKMAEALNKIVWPGESVSSHASSTPPRSSAP